MDLAPLRTPAASRPRTATLPPSCLAVLAALGCSGAAPSTPDASARDDASAPLDASASPDAYVALDAYVAPDGGPPPVVLTPTERAIVATLSPVPDLPPDPTNAYADDPEAAALGHALFWDARYSGPLAVDSDLGSATQTGRVSCASCHASLVMSDDRTSPGNVSVGAGFHTRNAPAVVNSARYRWTNWGGRFSAQWELPPVVAESPIIMNSTRLRIAHHIFDHHRAAYEAVFGPMEPAIGTDFARFPASGKPKASPTAPDGPWETMTAADQAIIDRIWINFGKAIHAYQRQLVSGEAPFDRFVAGDDDAISESAKRGLRLFVGEARCITCHSGPTFSDDDFHNLGVSQTGDHVPPSDDGRHRDVPGLLSSPFNSAGTWSDDPAAGAARLAGLTDPAPEGVRAAFRTPSLRDVEHSAPYMHAGQLATLEDVIAFYDAGGSTPASGTLDPMIFPLGLSAHDRADLVEFLRSLSGEPVPAGLRSAPAP